MFVVCSQSHKISNLQILFMPPRWGFNLSASWFMSMSPRWGYIYSSFLRTMKVFFTFSSIFVYARFDFFENASHYLDASSFPFGGLRGLLNKRFHLQLITFSHFSCFFCKIHFITRKYYRPRCIHQQATILIHAVFRYIS